MIFYSNFVCVCECVLRIFSLVLVLVCLFIPHIKLFQSRPIYIELV